MERERRREKIEREGGRKRLKAVHRELTGEDEGNETDMWTMGTHSTIQI